MMDWQLILGGEGWGEANNTLNLVEISIISNKLFSSSDDPLSIRTALAFDKTYIDLQIGQAMFIPSSSSGSSSEHVAITTQDTVSVLAPGKGFLSTLDHVIGGKLSCMDCTADRLALGVGSYGYGTLGNKVIYKIKRNILSN